MNIKNTFTILDPKKLNQILGGFIIIEDVEGL